MKPGSSSTTSMPKGCSSRRKQSLRPSTACLLAWYQLPRGKWILPAIEEVLRMRPRRA